MTAKTVHRLDGLEPDNLLAFLALLGLLRALEAADSGLDSKLQPRAAWDIDTPPLRPKLILPCEITADDVTKNAVKGIDKLIPTYNFENRKNLNYSQEECRALLQEEARDARPDSRERADLLAALMSDAIKKDKKDEIDPPPFCLLSGQGRQYFLERLANVPRKPAPEHCRNGKRAVSISESECLKQALFQPWHRNDDKASSFRWDPEDDVRYALMAGNPTDNAYKTGTQHGANRLAAIGLGVLTLAPEIRAGRARPGVTGGARAAGGFSFAWPIWREPATLTAIRALLAHPELREIDALAHLGVDHVMVARRISVGKYMNVSRARPLQSLERIHAPH